MPFPTTNWTLLAQATVNGDAVQKEAWAEFYRRYQEPVMRFIARQFAAEAQAEDLAQEFFVHVIENSTLQRADRRRGRFRTFLLGALTRFLQRQRVRAQAEKRGSGQAPVPLDGLAPGDDEPVMPPAVAAAFDREWARSLLERAREEIQTGWKGGAKEWTTLSRFLPGGTETPAYESAAAALGWPLARLKTEVHRVRRQFREKVRQEIALTVDEPQEIDAELAHLHRVLADPSA